MTSSWRQRWPGFLPGGTIAAALGADRAFAVVFACLALASWTPLLVTPVLPFSDLAGNVLSAGVLVRAILGDSHALRFYRVDWLPFPYWTTYLLLGTFELVLGPLLGVKVLVGLMVVLLPLAIMRLLIALGRDPRLSLWGFLLSWDHNLFAGWISYVIGMALALIVLAKVIEADDEPAARRVIPWSLLVALTHAMAVVYLLLAAICVACVRAGVVRRLRLHALALSGSAVVFLPWLTARFRAPLAVGRTLVDFQTPAERVSRFFSYTLDDVSGRFAEGAAGLALALCLFGPLLFASFRREEPARSDHRWSGAAIAAAGFLLYALLPFAYVGVVDNYYTYPRYATYVLAALLLVPPIRRVKTMALVPGVVVALACNAATAVAFHSFAGRARPFVELVDAVPAGARLLPLEYVSHDPAVKDGTIEHLHSYLTARGAFDPHLFDNVNTPIRYRDESAIPRISWLGPSDFTLEKYAPHYDYILVQGLAADPLVARPRAAGYHVDLLREAGMWRLYAVRSD